MVAPDGPPCGFPRAVRLRTPAEFQRVQTDGRTIDLGALVVRVSPRPPLPVATQPASPQPASVQPAPVQPARLGLAVSRRVGNAVARNRVKRRVRECFRRRQEALAGLDVVVSGRPQAAALELDAVERLFGQLLLRLGRS